MTTWRDLRRAVRQFIEEATDVTLPAEDGRRFVWVRCERGGVMAQLLIDMHMAQPRTEIIETHVLHVTEYGLNLDQLMTKYPPPALKD